jgi:multiple sugar transport system substrate-binding protein
VLQNADIKSTLDAQAKNMQTLLNDAKASCWPPDKVTAGQTCQVG